jgi:CheY-like chemotaxis protein
MDTLTKCARLLLADDHPGMLEQIVRLLQGEFEIAGTVGNGLDLTTAALRLDPDVVVLDITMPGQDGIEAARRLQHDGCRAKLVFLTVHDDPDYLGAALQTGAAGYVVKTRTMCARHWMRGVPPTSPRRAWSRIWSRRSRPHWPDNVSFRPPYNWEAIQDQ